MRAEGAKGRLGALMTSWEAGTARCAGRRRPVPGFAGLAAPRLRKEQHDAR